MKKKQKKAFCLLQQFEDVFANGNCYPGSCDWHKLRIQFNEDAQHSRVLYRAMNLSEKKYLKDEINKLQQKDLISPTHSE